MKRINLILIAVLILVNAYPLWDTVVYKDTNERGEMFIECYTRVSFSELEITPLYKVRIDYSLFKDDEMMLSKRDYQEFSRHRLNEFNIKYFDSNVWFPLDEGDYTIKTRMVELESRKIYNNEHQFSVKKTAFIDDMHIWRTKEKKVPSKTVLTGEDIFFSTNYMNENNHISWDFNIKDADNNSIYEIKGSTSAEKGLLQFKTPQLISLDLPRGDYSATFNVMDRKNSVIDSVKRDFSVDIPEFELDHSKIKRVTFSHSSAPESGRNIRGASSSVLLPVILENNATVGAIFTLFDINDFTHGRLITITSRIYFNEDKELLRWRIDGTLDKNPITLTYIDIDIANNTANPVVVRKDNPIFSKIVAGETQEKFHELKREKEIIIFPFINFQIIMAGSVQYASVTSDGTIRMETGGTSGYGIKFLLPDLYQMLYTVFQWDYSKKGRKLFLFDDRSKNILPRFMNIVESPGTIRSVQVNKKNENLQEFDLGIFNAKLYKLGSDLRKSTITNWFESDIIEQVHKIEILEK